MDYSAEVQNIISSKDKQIETLQKENNQLHFYQDVFKGLPINIYCVDKKGDVIDCNDEQIRAMGFTSPSEIIGKNLYDLLKKEEADKIMANNKIIIESKISQFFEEKVVTNDGQERIYLSQKTPLYDENKNVIGIFGSAIDITERKRMENKLLEAEKALAEMKEKVTGESIDYTKTGEEQAKAMCEYLGNIIDKMPGNIYWVNKNGVLLGTNINNLKTLGLISKEQCIGKKYEDFMSASNARNIRQINEKIMIENKEHSIEEIEQLENGKQRIYITQKVPLHDREGAIIGLLGISLDISDRKKMENDLREAKEKAEVANKVKTQFLLNMQHDLRTPAVGISETIKNMVADEIDKEKKRDLQDLVKSSQKLLKLVNDILSFSKIESAILPIFSNELDIREIVNDVVDLEITSANLKEVALFAKIEEDIPEKLIGDDHRLQKILLNLVGNAVKFTLEGHVKIDVSVHKKENNKIYLSIVVEDTGIGIPEEKFDFVFERFARVIDSNKELFEGSGLGLNVVKQFVEEMEGTINVESKLKKGTTFTCILPFDIPTEKEFVREKIDYDIEALKKCLNENPPSKILVVEDNRMAQVATARTLMEDLKSKVDVASTGEEALKLAKKNQYDLIFMDIGLPDINGYKVTEEIRKAEEDKEVKTSIVALTAHEPAEEANKSIAAGMNDFLTKPLTMEKGLVTLFKWVFQKKNPKLNVKNIVAEKKESTTKTNAIDWQLSIDLMNGNADAAKEMLELFITETLPADEKEIEEAFTKKDLSELVKTTHKMHGGLCYVGTPRLKEACKKLEVAAKLGEDEKIDILYRKLNIEIEEVKKIYNNNSFN